MRLKTTTHQLGFDEPVVVGMARPTTWRTVTSKEQDNKAIVARWFKSFWGNLADLSIVDELAAPDVLVHYPMHGPRRGREEVKRMMTEFRAAFPDLNFRGVGDLIAEGDYVVGRWDGGGTHTGPAFCDLAVGSLPTASGKTMRFTGTSAFRIRDGQIVEEIGEEGAATALSQLGLIPKLNPVFDQKVDEQYEATTKSSGKK